MAARACTLALAGILAFLAFPAMSAAKPCGGQTTAPPGQSEVDQYAETVPGACGDQTPGSDDGSGGGGSAGSDDDSAIPPATLDELESLGADGQAAAALAQANSPNNRQGTEAGGSSGAGGAAADDGPSNLSAVVDAVTGSDDGDGLGALLPLILAAIAGAGLAFVFLRRRADHAG